jgi:hypothetical protein
MKTLNPNDCCNYILTILPKNDINIELFEATSGCIMMWVEYNTRDYAIQFEHDLLGFSDTTDFVGGFDSKPDKIFDNLESLKNCISEHLIPLNTFKGSNMSKLFNI